jgi:hypothetical protein
MGTDDIESGVRIRLHIHQDAIQALPADPTSSSDDLPHPTDQNDLTCQLIRIVEGYTGTISAADGCRLNYLEMLIDPGGPIEAG